MARGKKKLEKQSVTAVAGYVGNNYKKTKRDRTARLAQRQLEEWNLVSFLDSLHQKYQFSSEAGYESLYSDRARYQPEFFTCNFSRDSWLPANELQKIKQFRCGFQKTKSVAFSPEKKMYFGRRYISLDGISIEVGGDSDETALQATSALVLSQALCEGKLARFLFENFLEQKRSQGHNKPVLYHPPEQTEVEPTPNHNPENCEPSNNANESPKGIKFPNAITLDEFLKVPDDTKPVCPSLEVKVLAGTLRFPSEVLVAMGDFAENSHGLTTFPFPKGGKIVGCKISIGSSDFEAWSNSTQNAIQACCALVLARYYGDEPTAFDLLQNYMKSTAEELLLFDQRRMKSPPKRRRLTKDVKYIPCFCSPPMKPVDLFLNGEMETMQLSHTVTREELESCKSPLEAVKILNTRELGKFSFGKFVFIPYRSVLEQKKVFGCAVLEGRGKMKYECLSSNAYVALQLCCTRFVSQRIWNKKIASNLLTKFLRVYRKQFECYENICTAFAVENKLAFACSVSRSFVEQMKLEDEKFTNAVSENRTVPKSVIDPEHCHYFYQKCRLFDSFVTATDSQMYNKKIGGPVFDKVSPESSECISHQYIIDVSSKLKETLGSESLEVYCKYENSTFVVKMIVDGERNFWAASRESLSNAFYKVTEKVLIFLESNGVPDNICDNKLSEMNTSELVNFLSSNHEFHLEHLDLTFLRESSEPDVMFVGEAVYGGRSWRSSSKRSKIDVMKEVLISICKFYQQGPNLS